ncbi:glycoside hydrolase family 25 protein [Mucilaginibacter sp. JRF]|uniref:GH25 family lysozyme n=1 Tax=Mucilaginibacter sp. JRF TaxID=2780088 RepID=UPI00187F775D|nr:glycoside hydrolase family 25 protein [Mucilaginibacter sp. JRF]
MPPRKQPAPAKPRTTVKRKPSATAKRKKKTGSTFNWYPYAIGLALVLLSPFYYGYVVKFFSSTWRWIWDSGKPATYRTYKSFDIDIPIAYKIHGIDVSYAQGQINWQQVSTMEEDSVRIHFAFIKATEGLLTADPYFKRNWREAPKFGIVCGAYHYFRPKKDGLWQARFFLQNVKPESGDLPPVVDIEVTDNVSPEKMRKELNAFIDHLEKKTHVKPIIYTNISFYKQYLEGYYDGYSLWIAHYYKHELNVSESTNWWFWQHSDRAYVNGIAHEVDFNAFKGDSLQFKQLLIP